MQNLNEQVEIIAGQTEVAVFRRDEDEKGNLQPPYLLHKGIVVENHGSFVRVFNPAPREKGGDLNPVCSESFPINGKRCFVQIIGQRKPVDAFPIPVELR